jgi:hypothetical protein
MKHLRLITTQTVELKVPPQSFPIEDYLRSPNRLMQTLAPAENLQDLGNDRYRLKISPMSVLNLTITPIVDINVWLDPVQKVQIESVAFEMLGLEGLRDRFDFKLLGELYPIHTPKEVLLRGSALLRIDLDLPRPFSIMPQSVIEGTGNAVLSATLGAVKGRMLQNLVKDYQQWSSARSGAILMGTD